MQYHQFQILCHRPYISRRYLQPQQPPQGPGPNHARKSCINAAVSIAQTLLLYEKTYTFHKGNVQVISYIFSAALILIFSTVPALNPTRSAPSRAGLGEGLKSGYPDQEIILTHLSTCFRALDAMGTCFENARRTSTFLGALQTQWQGRRQSQYRAAKKRKHQDQLFEKSVHAGSNSFANVNLNNPHSNQDIGIGLGAGAAGGADANIGDLFSEAPMPDDDPLSTLDFMDPDLCNILLSEGIPRGFVWFYHFFAFEMCILSMGIGLH